ncbi:MAG TPA: hypothetical protein VE862_00800, partial [Candidatus Acidoferrum sp.]|nr:hypothetical protein [Candidatus Acidoferrum sp.]
MHRSTRAQKRGKRDARWLGFGRRRRRCWSPGFPSLYRFFADFFAFFFGNISPTYRLSQIADKALIFDGNIVLCKLRSCLAWDGWGSFVNELERLYRFG